MTMVKRDSFPGEIDRSEVEEHLTWNVDDLYRSVEDWQAERDRVTERMDQISFFEGRLAESATILADALETIFELQKELTRLRVYAQVLSDQDTRDPQYQAMVREMVQLAADFSTRASYLRPEILRAGAELVRTFVSAEPRLEPYAFFLDDIVRRAEYTLSEREERILAAVGPLAGSPGATFNVFANADFPYPQVTLTDGRSVRITQAAYVDLRESPVREDRAAVMSAFFGALGSFENTFGTMMNGSIQKALFLARTRGFSSTLEATLFGPNIPVAVYENLVSQVNRGLPTLHRYLRLRKRILGVETLHYHDLYAPLSEAHTTRYSPEDARRMIVESMAPLGDEYCTVLDSAFDGRWIDWYATPGKRAGAYNNGSAYDVHPYVLLNYNGSYDAVSTVAHELGHALHSHFANDAQPYATAGFPIFLAEVASTFNEALLLDHVLESATDDDIRLSILGNYLETMRGTLFRQVKFAEFELEMHRRAEQRLPITGDVLSRMYLDLARRFYGHDQGVTIVDDNVAHEWSYVSHFYREFYVYQYATSVAAAETLAERVRTGVPGAREQYLDFLRSGGSDYPIETLRRAGIDMMEGEVIETALRRIDTVIGEIEAILDRQSR